jgi:hypothetical protein
MKDNIDPKWAWFWESKPTVALPFWEDSGKPRNYGYGLPELEFCETMPSWSFGPRGYGVESTGFAAVSIPSATSEVLRFNYDTNPRSGSISSGSRQAAFIGTTMFTDDEVSFRNPNGDTTFLNLAAYGDSTVYSAPYRDAIRFLYSSVGPNNWRVTYDRQVTFQLLHDASGQPYEPQPGEYFSWAFHIDDNNTGYMLLNGVHVQTRSNFFGAQDIGDSFSLGGRGFWKDRLWPTPIYCAYWWIEDRGSTIPTRTQLQQLHDDPWGPFRHYREELHTNVYPMQRNYSQNTIISPSPKVLHWNWSPDKISHEWYNYVNRMNFAAIYGVSGNDQKNLITGELGTWNGTSGNQLEQTVIGDGWKIDGWTNIFTTHQAAPDGSPRSLLWIANFYDITNRSPAIGAPPGGTGPRLQINQGTKTLSYRDDRAAGAATVYSNITVVEGNTSTIMAVLRPEEDTVLFAIHDLDTGRVQIEEVPWGWGRVINAGNTFYVSNRQHAVLVVQDHGYSWDRDDVMNLFKDPFGPFRHNRETQPVRILAPQFASHLSVIVNSNVTGNPIIISPVPSNGSFMTIS